MTSNRQSILFFFFNLCLALNFSGYRCLLYSSHVTVRGKAEVITSCNGQYQFSQSHLPIVEVINIQKDKNDNESPILELI